MEHMISYSLQAVSGILILGWVRLITPSPGFEAGLLEKLWCNPMIQESGILVITPTRDYVQED